MVNIISYFAQLDFMADINKANKTGIKQTKYLILTLK